MKPKLYLHIHGTADTHKNDLLHWGWHWTLWHHYFFMTLITHTQYEADPETLWHHYFFKTIITHTQYEADPETLWHHYFFMTIITHTQYVLS